MAERQRGERISMYVTDDEKELIRNKMAILHTRNMGAYLRKMAIDGYIIQVDYTEAKKLTAAVSRVAANVNQLCRRINAIGRFYDDDIAEMKRLMEQIWDLLKAQQKEEL